MPAPVKVEFLIGGVKEVQEAFRTIRQSATQHEGATARVRERGEKAAKEGAERTGRAVVGAAERAARQRERIALRSAQMAGSLAAKEVREAERAADAKVKAHERAIERMNRAQRTAIERNAVLERAGRERFAGGIAGRAVASGASALRGVAGVGSAILGVAGGFSAVDSVRSGIANRGKAADLSIASGGAVSRDQILEKSEGLGTRFGTSTESVIEGLDAFVAKSGDVKGGFEAIQELVELATATGADLGELSRTAGILQMTTGNTGKTMEQMRDLAGMGRAGSVDMRELSQYAGRISAGSSQFTDKSVAMKQLSAIVQQAAATGGATAAPEATEAVTRLATDVYEHESAFKSKGIKTRDKTGKFLNDPMSIIKQSIHATKGDSGQLLDMFGKMSYRAVAGYQDVYNRSAQGVRASGGSEQAADAAGMKAIDDAFEKFAESGLKADQVRDEAARRTAEVDKQLESVMNDLRESVGRELIPEVIRLVPKLKELVPTIAELVRKGAQLAAWMGENPYKGIGAIIAAKIAADLAGAAIGEGAKIAITKALAAMGAGGSVAIPIASAAITIAAVEAWSSGQASDQRGAAMTVAGSSQTAGLTAPQLQAKRDEVAKALLAEQGKLEETQKTGGHGWGSAALHDITSFVNPQAAKDAQATEEAALKRNVASLAASLTVLDAALKKTADAASKSNPNDPSRNGPQPMRPQ